MNKEFTHLHLHTQYSFLDGAIRIKDLIKRVGDLGMGQVAVTDHGNMYGALDFYTQSKKAGIKPILGIEAYVTGKANYTDKVKENYHLVLLAENNIGYENLKKLSSEAFINGKYYFPRIDKKLLFKHKEGLIASTACLGGEVAKKCAQNDLDGARNAIREFKSIFGPNNFFLEVQPNGLKIQDKVNAHLADFAKDEGLRLVATNDCHYVTQDQHEAQNILMAIRQQKALDDPTLHKHETNAFYIRSHEEMYELLKSDYEEAFFNACEIGQRCKVDIPLGKVHMPQFPFPSEYKDEEDYLRFLAKKGLKRRILEATYPIDQDHYGKRLESELDCITRMGFSGYFLIVQDFINWAKDHEIKVGPGRGSGAGSLVAYSLRITDIDPIPYNLLFERFLNPERVSLPDFDVDFMQEGRADVINYVGMRYGKDRVAQIATYSALNPKSAIKDVARTVGIPFSEINELTKPMPLLIDGKKPGIKQALEYAPKLKEKALTDDIYKRILENASILEGLYRQAGMHAGGIVISQDDLIEHVPVFSGQNGEIITQFDKDKVEEMGLIKFDFLGLKTLDVIANAEKLINARADKKENPLRVELLPPNESQVYELISSGDTLGIFQVESSGFQEMCRKLKPDCFEDIVAAVALYRPGPMQSGMVDDFIDRKHGRKQVVYPHPSLESVLKPTYGTIVYQEQVMQIAQVLSGYTLGDADLLRRAMGKKKAEEMESQRAAFVLGAQKNGVSKEKASQIFDLIEKFAGYAFNKSHSAAYAMITYQTGYLKKFYPIEFMAALLTTSSGNTLDVVKYIHEAKAQGIKVLGPDVNISKKDFSVDENGHIRFGLTAVKGLGVAALLSILDIRKDNNLIKNLYEFCQLVNLNKVNKKVLEALIKSGAMDSFKRKRKQLMLSMDKAMAQAQKINKDKDRGQTNMFDMLLVDPKAQVKEEYEDVDEYSKKELLGFEKEILGFYLSGHPMEPYEKTAKDLGLMSTLDLINVNHLQEISIAGLVESLKERPLKSGHGRWAVLSIEDSFGQIEGLCFSKAYEEALTLLKSDEPLIFKGKAIIDDEDEEGKPLKPKIRIEEVKLLKDTAEEKIKIIKIYSQSEFKIDDLNKLKEIIEKYPGNKKVIFCCEIKNKLLIEINLNIKVNPNEKFLSEIKNNQLIKGVIFI